MAWRARFFAHSGDKHGMAIRQRFGQLPPAGVASAGGGHGAVFEEFIAGVGAAIDPEGGRLAEVLIDEQALPRGDGHAGAALRRMGGRVHVLSSAERSSPSIPAASERQRVQ